jgi:hypothetical protein
MAHQLVISVLSSCIFSLLVLNQVISQHFLPSHTSALHCCSAHTALSTICSLQGSLSMLLRSLGVSIPYVASEASTGLAVLSPLPLSAPMAVLYLAPICEPIV